MRSQTVESLLEDKSFDRGGGGFVLRPTSLKELSRTSCQTAMQPQKHQARRGSLGMDLWNLELARRGVFLQLPPRESES